jgi:pimeloyl-ACP methyl ester carboxylesterase
LPFVSLTESPLVAGAEPVEIFYRETGGGRPLIFLHGGWGYEVYPFTRQIETLGDRFRIVIPDRSGYGRSSRIAHLPPDFHSRAAVETMSFIEALGIQSPLLWGHSDGAVIAALMCLAAPGKFSGLIMEAFHYYRVKPASREFFEKMVLDPDKLDERAVKRLAEDHGEDHWRSVIEMNGRAWLAIAETSAHPGHDLYDGRLSQLIVPATFIHGSRDPRTEPGELDAVRRELPRVRMNIIEDAGHSPHSKSASSGEATRLAEEFIARL